MDFLRRPAWIEINLDNFIHNIKEIKNKISEDVQIMSIVKSDGYRLGAIPFVRESRELGVKYYGVATLSEALALRKEFEDVEILILGYTPDYLFKSAIENNIILSLSSLENGLKLNEKAKELNKTTKVHIAFDSGMSRIGFLADEEHLDEVEKIYNLSNLNVEGIFSHFAACEGDHDFTKNQFDKFSDFLKRLEKREVIFKYKHIANSASILFYREYDFNMVRPGIIQYGLTDAKELADSYNLKEIFELKAQIASIREVKKGETVGYERNYTCDKDTKIVTIPLGYADAFPRILSGKIEVLINGVRCPQVGLICMDQMMVDATDVEVKIGDEGVLIGKQGDEEIRVRDICKFSGDCETSFITHFNRRLPKHYFKNNKLIDTIDII
ncbi:alanine racemase [Peptoniphilus sp. MSJ-1]|uniref:Alanine racemase n=1 Tax=Peptoniphilus ovalis TaxID=2841503 RepID=A0ABS6FIC8_9FIRM|nr:alanine racemase [Peptoniphilus ovalis]MBU5668986.1 alanine racemase [Peptoniphilus ovalis]